MKKIFSFIFLPLILAGCVNLDYYASDAMTSASLAANPAAAVYTTDGVYSMMKDMSEFRGGISQNNTFTRQYFLLNDVRADDICFSWTSTDPFWTSAQYLDDANSADANYMWMSCYKMIYATNSNIAGLQDETDAPSEQNQLKGENYFLRAFFHLVLCNLYAKPYSFGRDNPGIVLRIGTDYSVTERATVGQCYDAIEKDLKEAIRLMDPKTKRGDNGYASKVAAQALLSRVYLYEERWQDCIDVCNDILVNDPSTYLETEVKDVYSKASSNKEVIWCIDITDADVANWGGSVKGLLGSMFDSPDGTQGRGWGELYVADPLLDLLERYPNDKRYTQLVRLFNAQDGLFITWGETDDVNSCLTNVNVYPNVVSTDPLVIASSITDNGDGTYSFTYDGKAYKAIPDNTATKYSDEFPGYILNDAAHTRCYVRHKMPTPIIDGGKAVFEANMASVRPGGYPTWFCNKFSVRDGSAYELNASYIMIRYAEVILNRAEAYAHLGGNDAKAIADVNAIRTRAGLTGDAQMSAANMTARGYANAIDMVLDERRMEFFYEGHRVMDLMRNKKDIDRRFPSRTKTEVIPYNSPSIQYQIPIDETSVSGIPINER